MSNLFWGFNSEDGYWQALPAGPFLIPAILTLIPLAIAFQYKEQQGFNRKLSSHRVQDLIKRRAMILSSPGAGGMHLGLAPELFQELKGIDQTLSNTLRFN